MFMQFAAVIHLMREENHAQVPPRAYVTVGMVL